MTILIEPSLACDGNCTYCYNRNMREAVHESDLNINLIIDAMQKYKGSSFCLHGGEPLILPLKVLERLFLEMLRLGGGGSVQSSLSNLKPEHFRLFKTYNIEVGTSLDGFGELNRFRTNDPDDVWSKFLELKREGVSGGFLTVISKANGLPEQRDQFKDFVRSLHRERTQARLLPGRHPNPDIQLTIPEALDFYSDILDFMIDEDIKGWSPFSDVVHATQDDWEKVWCRFSGCDPFSTSAGIVITREGYITTCHKFKDKDYNFINPRKDTRANLLYQTDCKGCNWFRFCRGGCPADAVDFDWRNKTYWCPVYKMIFNRLGSSSRIANK